MQSPEETLSRAAAGRLGIGGLLTLLVALFIVVFGVVAAFLTLGKLHDEKTTDVWAIQYLELEREVRLADRKIARMTHADEAIPLTAEALAATPADAVVAVDGGKLTLEQGWVGKRGQVDGLSFMLAGGRRQRLNVWAGGGQNYLARLVPAADAKSIGIKGFGSGGAILLWRADPAQWLASADRSLDGIVAYAINREGQLVYTSRKDITAATATNRTLVQEFVKAPLTRGQMEVETEEGEAYGMFHQVGETNLILFKEVPQDVVMAPLRRMALSLAITMALVLLLGLLLLQLPMIKLVTPLRQLAVIAKEIGKGNLSVRPMAATFGEVGVLSHTFRVMIDGLVQRDVAIARFIEEQKEAVRLQGELKVAQGIQNTLLPQGIDMAGAGVELAVHYEPAAECAGDWYSHSYTDETGEVLVAIADVSGHGAGSAMFTAVIAGLFEQTRLEAPGKFDSLLFFKRLNRVMMKMGRQKWHTTFTILRYVKGSDEIEVANAGGTPPYVLRTADGKGVVKPELIPSELIGLAETDGFAAKTVAFPPGSALFLYTDGLTEAVDDGDKMYGKKRLRKTLENGVGSSSAALVNRVHADWNAHRGAVAADDDLCLMALRRAG